MDLDEFGQINATFGWPTGDIALKQFAAIATAAVRSLDWLARYGGEEFCLVMPDTDRATGMQVAERIRAAVAAANVTSVDRRPVPMTISIGVVEWAPDLGGPIGWLQKLSDAVLAAKRDGKNRVVAG